MSTALWTVGLIVGVICLGWLYDDFFKKIADGRVELESRLDDIDDRLSSLESDVSTVARIARKYERLHLQTYDDAVAQGLRIDTDTDKERS